MTKASDAGGTFQDVLRLAIDSRIAGIHTALPAKILDYDHETQKARVQPLIKKAYLDGKVESLPVVDHVPVIWPRTTGVDGATVSFTFPVRQDDLCLLLFAERALENWLTAGGEQEPGDPRKHDLTDAVALMGLSPFTLESKAENNDDVLLTYSGDGHERRVQITPDKIYVRFDDSTLDLTHTGTFRARLAFDGAGVERKLEIRPGQTILQHGPSLVLKLEPEGANKIDLNFEGDKQLKVTGSDLKLRYGDDADLFMDAGTAVLRVLSSSAEINDDGDILAASSRDISATVGRNLVADVTQDVGIAAGGDLVADVTGNADVDVGGDLTAEVTGDLTADVTGNIEATATNIKLKASSECRLEGATVRVKTSDFDLGPAV